MHVEHDCRGDAAVVFKISQIGVLLDARAPTTAPMAAEQSQLIASGSKLDSGRIALGSD